MNSSANFETSGAVQVDSFIDNNTASIISLYMENKIHRGEWQKNNYLTSTTHEYAYYADPLTEALLVKCKDEVESITGKSLLPTYSFARVYQAGEKIEKHTDRESCEVSVAVCVAYKGDISPLHIELSEGNQREYFLKPGDAVVYEGCKSTHWRETLLSDQLCVLFYLHYVDENGPNKDFVNDKRPRLGSEKIL
jgi:hypothetical protein